MKPLVSVVIPTFRRFDALEATVSSALNQRDTDVEIIVVDDGSTTPPDDIMSRFEDDGRVVYLPQKHNCGGGAARNVGIERARGRYIGLLDSDDRWKPGKLSRQLEVLNASPYGELAVCFTRLEIETEFGVRATPAVPVGDREHIADYMFVRGGQIQTSSVVLHATLAKRVLFDPSLPRLQDWDFYLRLAEHGAQFVQLPEILSVYAASDDPGRVSNRRDPDFLREWINSWQDRIPQRAYLGYIANKLAPELLLCGRRRDGVHALMQGVRAGVVKPRSALIELTRAMLPAAAFNVVRSLVNTRR